MTENRVFDELKACADALRDLHRWEIVLDRSLAYFDMAVTNGWVWEGDVNGKAEFPFAWMFPKKGHQKRHAQRMAHLQVSLLFEFRAILTILTSPLHRVAEEEDELDHRSKLPPRKRFRETQPQKKNASVTPKLMMKFSPNKIQRMVSEEEENTAFFV